MSKSNRVRNKRTVQSATMLGIGAVIVGTLAGCSNQSSPATTSAATPTTAVAASTATTQTSEPSATPTTLPAVAEATQAPATTEPTATSIPPTATAVATATSAPAPAPASTGKYKDGQYVGEAVPADRWGDLQVRATIQGGQLVKIDVVSFPNHTRRSELISRAALPTLISEAIQNQDAQVDVVSRATDVSEAFKISLGAALSDAAVVKPSV